MRRNSNINLEPLKGYDDTVGGHIDFIRNELTLPESRQLITLNDYQLELIEEWFEPSTKAHVTIIGAGNAKTTTLGAFVTAHMFLTYEAYVPVVAATVKQAVNTTWGRVKRFVELNPKLLERAEILEGQGTRSGIYVPVNNNHCQAVADLPANLQGLNPSIAILEEMSEASTETFGSLMNRLGKRPSGSNNKLIGISTPSFTADNALLRVQRAADEGEGIPGVVLKTYISDQKDIHDESQWHKANPGLAAGVLDIEAIRVDAATQPEQWFRAYRLCQQPLGSKSCWLNSLDDEDNETGDGYEVWMRGEKSYTFDAQAPTYVGVDVAKSRDHAAVVWGQYTNEGVLHTKCKIWTPTRELEIDLDDIASHLYKLNQDLNLDSIFYDPAYFYNAAQLATDKLPMVEVPQTSARMAPYVGHAYEQIRKGFISHDEDEQFTLHVLAGVRHYVPSGFTIKKAEYTRKCDAAIALVLCHAAATQPKKAPLTDESLKFHYF